MNTNSCPFCNAPLPPLAAAPTADKLPCPRCGELVPAARWRVDPAAHGVREGEPIPQVKADNRGEFSSSNRKTAFVVVGIMLAMAIVGGSYALWTTKLRQSRHPWMPQKEEPIARRRPIELSGLGYLPKNVHVLAGLHIAEMMSDKDAGRALMEEPRPGVVDWALKQISRTTGVGADGLDHVVVATALDANFPQLVMIVKTRTPYDLTAIAKVAKPATPPIHQDKPLYQFSLNPIGEAFVWCVEERTLIYVFRQDQPKLEHLSGISATPKTPAEALPVEIADVMKERLATHHYAWMVGRIDQFGPLREWLPKELASLKDVRTFALGIEPVEGLTLTGHFLMTDAKAAAGFKTFLEIAAFDGAKSRKVETTPPEAKEAWLTWQVRSDAAALRTFLNRGKNPGLKR